MTMRHDTYEAMHDILRKIKLNDPNISEAEAREQLWEAVSESEAKRGAWKNLKQPQQFFRLLVDNWHLANWSRYEAQVEEGKVSVRFTSRASGPKSERRKVVAQRVITRAAGTILLNLPMPNGKLLRNCTGAECSKFQGWFRDISKHVGPSEVVGKKLTETELQNLYGRNVPNERTA